MKFVWALGAILCLGSAPLSADTILVIPFSNTSRSANLDWIGESVAETIREALANQGLMVLNRDDRQEAYRRLALRPDSPLTRATIMKVGQALDADQVVYGSFDLTPPAPGAANTRGSLKIAARILDLRRMRQGGEFSQIGALEDLAASQTHLAWQTLQHLAARTVPSEAEFSRQAPAVRVDAMENYIRGLLATAPDQKLRFFSQAIRIEPQFSDAAYQLGLLAYSRKDFRGALEWLQKVSASDIHSRQATFLLGIARFETGDYAGAQGAFERVAADVPLNEVFNNLGAAQSRRNTADALDSFRKALDGDPSDPMYHFNTGVALWKRGQLSEAADRFRAVLDRNPQDQEATTMLGRCLRNLPPKPAELKERVERLKTNFQESAYWQLKALLQSGKP